MSRKLRILVVLGTRPEAIKLCPLYLSLRRVEDIEVKMCTTGQHREMLAQVLNVFEIEPEYSFEVMKQGQSLSGIASTILSAIDPILQELMPDVVIVQGDTTTAFAVALASYHRRIKIAHVEAGLRTYRLDSPWPEEGNRQLVSRIADFHFAPTEEAKANLLAERINENRIFVTGNTVIDALQWTVERNRSRSAELRDSLRESGYTLKPDGRVVLITGHRRENWGRGIENLANAIAELSSTFPDVDFVFPVHLNPIVRNTIYDVLGRASNVHLMNPVEYSEFVFLLANSYLVLTDSGGIQEEAPSLGKPVLVVRDTTERPEGVDAGTVRLVGSDRMNIVKNVTLLLNDRDLYQQMSAAANPYGDGKACRRISDILRNQSVGGMG